MSQIATTGALPLEQPRALAATSGFKLGHRPELDGVRGISILLVLLLHLGFSFFGGGFLGVDIFFVLSGFLITSLLAQEFEASGSISLKRFYIRRALRLMPAVGVYLLVNGTYAFLFLDRGKAALIYQGILLSLSYVSNWVFAFFPTVKVGPLGITWSLAIEEQFLFRVATDSLVTSQTKTSPTHRLTYDRRRHCRFDNTSKDPDGGWGVD